MHLPKKIKHFLKKERAFTIIELLVSIGVIGILATIVIVAVNPSKILTDANDTGDTFKEQQLEKALQQYLIQNGSWPPGITASAATICSHGASGSCLQLHDELASEVDPTRSFMAAIPQASEFTSPDSGFEVYINGAFIEVDIKTP